MVSREQDEICGFKQNIFWARFIALICFIKLALFIADSVPMFYQGDSIIYMQTAFRDIIPRERSFVYGFIVKIVAIYSHSLHSLVLLQVLASAFSAVILTYILVTFFSLSPVLSCFFGILCSLEPLQLFYERYVMTETLTLFCLTIYIYLAFAYLRKSGLRVLAFFQVAGFAIICFRVFYVPLIALMSVGLPLLAYYSSIIEHRMFSKSVSASASISIGDQRQEQLWQKGRYTRIAIHLGVSVVLAFGLMNSYRHLNGYLCNSYPTFNYSSGVGMLAVWSPIAEPQDFPIPELREKVFDVSLDIKYKLNRAAQYVWEGQLADNIKKNSASLEEANRLASQTAFNAVKRDPWGFVSLIFSDYLDYLNKDELRHWMTWDRGVIPFPENFLKDLDHFFGLSAAEFPNLKTVTNRYFFAAWPWYQFLVVTPFVSLLTLLMVPWEQKKYSLVIFVTLLFVVTWACVTNAQTTVRYIHATSWFCFLALAPLFSSIVTKKKLEKSSAENT